MTLFGGDAMKGNVVIPAILLAALAASPAFGQGSGAMPRYEPSQRARTALDTCLKDEVMNGAWCVKKCQKDFRLDPQARPPVCIGLKADAKYQPPEPTWKPPTQAIPRGAPGS
jgi:hypothetical protein